MLILNSPQVVQETALRWKRDTKIALIPTMGCLHEGHLALVRRARELAEKTIVSVFVNPLQFGPGEDFDRYPRSFEEDSDKLHKENVDLVFHPSVDDLYPQGFATRVQTGEIGHRLCGKFRPGHFDGVATICLKLFSITQPDFAIFGEKDFQQLRIIQNMTTDFNLPVTIVGHPTVRDTDGLALSSRNTYLSSSERAAALTISKFLFEVQVQALSTPGFRVSDVMSKAEELFSKIQLKLQYINVTKSRDLLIASPDEIIQTLPSPRVFVAAYSGTTRLIDNISLQGLGEIAPHA